MRRSGAGRKGLIRTRARRGFDEGFEPLSGAGDGSPEAVCSQARSRWLEESAQAERAYRRWSEARSALRAVAFAEYRAALDREEAAARHLDECLRTGA